MKRTIVVLMLVCAVCAFFGCKPPFVRISETELASLYIEGVSLEPHFTPSCKQYSARVANSTERVRVEAVPVVLSSQVTIRTKALPCIVELAPRENTIRVHVAGKDGSADDYVITIVRDERQGIDLSHLSLDGLMLEPAFNPGILNYSALAAHSMETTRLRLGAASGSTLTVNGETYDERKPCTFVTGRNVISIDVSAVHEGTTVSNTYTIEVNRMAQDVAELASLEITGYNLDPAFTPSIRKYKVIVPYSVDEVKVDAASHDGRPVYANGTTAPCMVKLGAEESVVTVKTGDTAYTVELCRTKNADVSIMSIFALSHDKAVRASETGPNDNPRYECSVSTEQPVRIIVIPAASSSKAYINGKPSPQYISDFQLQGTHADIKIVSESGQEKRYELIMYSYKILNAGGLVGINVGGLTLSPAFDANINRYTVSVPYGMQYLDVAALVKNPSDKLTMRVSFNIGSPIPGQSGFKPPCTVHFPISEKYVSLMFDIRNAETGAFGSYGVLCVREDPVWQLSYGASGNGSMQAVVDGKALTASPSAVIRGAKVVCRATPDSGYELAGWVRDGNPVNPNAGNDYEFVIDKDTRIEARFQKKDPDLVLKKLSMNVSGYGNVDALKDLVVVPASCLNAGISFTAEFESYGAMAVKWEFLDGLGSKVDSGETAVFTLWVDAKPGKYKKWVRLVAISQDVDMSPASIASKEYAIAGLPSFTMKAVRGGIEFPFGKNNEYRALTKKPYWIADSEVTYELWYEVKRWAKEHGYVFYNSGREGAEWKEGIATAAEGIGAAPTSARKTHPVTEINTTDAIVWCNALTEYYNAHLPAGAFKLDCVYYSDPAYTRPLRDSTNIYGSGGALPAAALGTANLPYIKSSQFGNTDAGKSAARGFRLPLAFEWELASRLRTTSVNAVEGVSTSDAWYFTNATLPSGMRDEMPLSTTDPSYDDPPYAHSYAVCAFRFEEKKTAAVKTKLPNSLGLYDMSGNASEFFMWPGDLGLPPVCRPAALFGAGGNATTPRGDGDGQSCCSAINLNHATSSINNGAALKALYQSLTCDYYSVRAATKSRALVLRPMADIKPVPDSIATGGCQFKGFRIAR